MPPISRTPRLPSPSLKGPIWEPWQRTLLPAGRDSARTALWRGIQVNEMDQSKDDGATACFQVPTLLHIGWVTLIKLLYLSVRWSLHPSAGNGDLGPSVIATAILPSTQPGGLRRPHSS